MTPAQARAFHAVAVEGSFTAAAKVLGVSQPTVTNQIKLIETRYRVELFHRTSRGVRLTKTGEELLGFVRRMFGSYQEALSYLEQVRGMRRGHLRVGSYGPYGVTRMIARYRARYPDILTTITFANSRTLAVMLLQYELDVAVFGRVDYQPELFVLPYSKPALVVIAPRTPEWSSRRTITRAELLQQTIICREQGSAARAALDRLLGSSRFDPDRLVEVGSREGVISAVAEGMGFAAIFDEGLLPEERVVKLRIKDAKISSSVDIVCLAERRLNPIINAFLSVAADLRTCGLP